MQKVVSCRFGCAFDSNSSGNSSSDLVTSVVRFVWVIILVLWYFMRRAFMSTLVMLDRVYVRILFVIDVDSCLLLGAYLRSSYGAVSVLGCVGCSSWPENVPVRVVEVCPR
ncbi:putative serine/arginine repetitive matrix protein 1 isoform X1 [Iris pallida]|uniref:Serine/arginine repetitive matrix protein 1 isoform X1 n=1 Tax=Iris pallida TaxID=29817 RepID=A0AAX6FM92_IRIPA|nr:putative serine/arginine repetitive matrix protein 1 isoform X1 [Iris pallida]